MKLVFLSIVFVCSITTSINAQQDPHYSLYRSGNLNILNPAAAGSGDFSELNLNLRSQWAGIKDSPETQSLTLNVPMEKNIGIGLSVINDNVFVLNETHVYADFSYKLKLAEKTDLFLGLKAGGSFLDIDIHSLYIENDPLFSENVNEFNPNFGAGAYLKGEKYFLSFSVPGILKSDRYERKANVPVEASDVIHLYTYGGYTFKVTDEVDLTPSLLVKLATGAPVSYEISLTGTVYEQVELAASYRNNESFTGLFRLKVFDWMKLGYAFEYTVSDIRTEYNNGTHELNLSFSLGKY